MRLYKNIMIIMSLLLGSMAVYAEELPIEINLSNDQVTRGETFWVHIKADPKSKLKHFKVHFEDQTISAMPHPKYGKHNYLALVGVPMEHEVGEVDFYINSIKQPNTLSSQNINVIDGAYGKEEIKVAKKYTDLPHRIKKRIEDEWLLIRAFYNSIESTSNSIPQLVLPIDNTITSPFGTHRVFNGAVQSYHNGIDLRAPEGTAIEAPQAGRVLFTSDLYYAGRHIVLDHGGGVLTTYSHLSDIAVKPGDKVKPGQVIGYSGATGRVSGPHLHWTTKVNKVTVNPIQLQELLNDLG